MDTQFSSHSINYENLAQAVHKEKEQMPEAPIADHVRTVLQREHGMVTERLPQTSPETKNIELPKDNHLPDYAQTASEDTKQAVEQLITITLEKGIRAGLNAAKEKDPLVIDMFHDALIDKLSKELMDKNLL